MQRVSANRKPKIKSSGRRTRRDCESDEESPATKRQRKIQTPPKRSGVAHDGGQQFEVKMAAVVGLRGMARGDNFQLHTNKPDCGNFDDLVYTTSRGLYFLQLKYTDNPEKEKLTKGYLGSLLLECFESYYIIIHGPIFKNISPDNSEFIIYTNKQLGPELLQHSRRQRDIDVILRTRDEGEIFNFTPDKNKEIDIYTLVENSVKNSKMFRGLSLPQREVKFMISEFLKKLIMVTGQKGQRELDALIIDEIRKQDAVEVPPTAYERELLFFKKPLESWWRDKKDKITPEKLRNWLQGAKTESWSSVVSSLCDTYGKTFVGTGINFSDTEISRLQGELCNKNATHLRTDALTLCSILLLDSLPHLNCIFVDLECLKSHTDELLHAWLGGNWEWLIVSCESTSQATDISNTCAKLSYIIGLAPLNKRVIILSSLQQKQRFLPVDHVFKFEQLSKKSQEIVLDKKVDFQGCEVTIRSVLQGHGIAQDLLGTELVTDLITETNLINIGGRLQVNTDYYVPRVLRIKIYLHLNVLQNPNSHPDIFAFSGIKTNDLLNVVSSRESVGKFSLSIYTKKEIYDASKNSRFITMFSQNLETCFSKLCEKHSGRTLHWVEFSNGGLLWKMSRGDTDNLRDYIDAEKTGADRRIIAECMENRNDVIKEDLIWKLNERTVLVIAEAGMGKSTSTSHLSWNRKLADPTSWVLRINWNEHSRKLEEMNSRTCSVDTFVQFVGSAVFPGSKYYNLSTLLLKQALEVSGNVTVLTNGYDQLSPIHAEKADAIMSSLRKTRVRRICVMSCPVARERLGKGLGVKALTLEALPTSSQELILLNLWTSKVSRTTDQTCLMTFIKQLLSLANKSVYDRSFVGTPLFITMIATAFEQNLEVGDFSLPKKFDLVYLYDRFFERVLYNYQIEKIKECAKNGSVQCNNEILARKFSKNVEECALISTLPSATIKSLHDKEIGEETEPFVSEVVAGKHKTDLAITAVDGRPSFVRPAFAQCLTARWFCSHFDSNRSVLEDLLFKPSYKVVKAEFDRRLANGSQLHSAVLDLDIQVVESLLQAGIDVGARDRGGRTALHLIATQEERAFWVEDITKSLLEHGAPLNDRDNVLHWTPLRYAIKSGTWFVAEQLLEHNVDRKDLEVIINRIHDTDYIGDIVVQAVQGDCFLLVQFLKSVGVNIDKTFTTMKVTALHVAAENRRLRILKWLLEQGAYCDITCNLDQTPLIMAARDGCIESVRMLVEVGGSPLDLRDSVGRTALDWAIIQAEGGTDSYYLNDTESDGRIGAEAVVKYLREKGCTESNVPDGVVHDMTTGFTNLSMDPTP